MSDPDDFENLEMGGARVAAAAAIVFLTLAAIGSIWVIIRLWP